jgi:hypothetical protein
MKILFLMIHLAYHSLIHHPWDILMPIILTVYHLFIHYTIFWNDFCMKPSIFCFPQGLGNLSLSTIPLVDTIGDYYLLRTSVTQVIFMLHYFHTCTHQVLYLVITLIRCPTIKSFTQPRLHKLLILHIKPCI